MSVTNESLASANASGYPSLTPLRTIHLKLLELRRTRGDGPAFQTALLSFIARGSATGLILDDDNDRLAAQSILDYWANVLHRLGIEPPDANLADFDDESSPQLPDEPCPYVGLEAFREGDKIRFFGRQQLIADMAERMHAQRLIAVVGPSGSGKSSVVRAGLLPALKEGIIAHSSDWLCLPPIVPGSDPLAALAYVLRPRQIAPARWARVAQDFRSRPDYLAQLLGKMTQRVVVITVDQFEELFTLCTDEAERQAFVDNLISLTHAKDRVHFVILTMRVDFEQFVQLMPDLQQLFVAGRIPVLPLNAAEMREAIELPAKQVGLKFETGVIDRLLSDILGEAAGLPLLQFTLLRLWEERKRNRVTQEIYDRVGGGRLALARSADAFYEALLPEDQVTARRILLRMVRPGSGTEVTSSRILRAAVFTRSDDSSRVERVLEKLITSRLVRLTTGETPDDDQIEVAHEALVRNWPRLVEWIEQERDSLRQRLRLRESARQWDVSGREPALLWRGTILDDATQYDDLDRIERAFIGAGLAAEYKLVREKELAEAEREAARDREIVQMRALAEEQELRSIAVQERAAAESQRAEEQSRRLEVEQHRAEEQSRTAGRLRRLSSGLLIALLVVVAVALFAGAQQVLLGASQSKAATAVAANAKASTEQAVAITQAGIAQATGAAVSTSAAQAATSQAVAEAQAKTATSVAGLLQQTINAGTNNFEQLKTQATFLRSTSAAIRQTADAAQAAASKADQDAQAALAAANVERGSARQAQTDAAQAKSEASGAQSEAASAQTAATGAQKSADNALATAKAAEESAKTIDAGAKARLQQVNQTLEAVGPALTIIALSATPTPTPTRTPTPASTRTPAS